VPSSSRRLTSRAPRRATLPHLRACSGKGSRSTLRSPKRRAVAGGRAPEAGAPRLGRRSPSMGRRVPSAGRRGRSGALRAPAGPAAGRRGRSEALRGAPARSSRRWPVGRPVPLEGRPSQSPLVRLRGLATLGGPSLRRVADPSPADRLLGAPEAGGRRGARARGVPVG
jgi:hypothetical protein